MKLWEMGPCAWCGSDDYTQPLGAYRQAGCSWTPVRVTGTFPATISHHRPFHFACEALAAEAGWFRRLSRPNAPNPKARVTTKPNPRDKYHADSRKR